MLSSSQEHLSAQWIHRLVSELDRRRCYDLQVFEQLLPIYEETIRQHAMAAITRCFDPFLEARPHSQRPKPGRFIYKGQLYEVMSAAVPTRPELGICIQCLTQHTCHFREGERIHLNAGGLYDAIQLQVAQELADKLTCLTEHVKAIYKVGYAWLEEQFLGIATDVGKDFCTSAYRHIRTLMAQHVDPVLADQVWLSAFSKDKGVYVIDPRSLKSILEQLKTRRFATAFSPIELANNLLTLQMPTGESLSQYVIRTGQYAEFELRSDARYATQMPGVFVTEQAMVRDGAYAVFPIGEVKDHALVAAFPSQLRSQLQPVFEQHAPQLLALYRKDLNALNRHVARIRRVFRTVDPQGRSAAAGAFFGEFMRHYFK